MSKPPRPGFPMIALFVLLALLLAACPADDEVAEPEPEPEPVDEPVDEPDEPAPALDEPIRIGYLGPLSGPFAIWGPPTRNGMMLAINEINDAGGVLGQPIELLERDTENSPDEGVIALRGLVEREEVVAVGGLISSDVGLATSRVAEEMQVPIFMVKAGSHRILTPDSRYTFRTCLPAAPTNMEAWAGYIQDAGIERVGAVIADYEWGHSIREGIEQHIEPLEGVEVQLEVAPLPETDFTTYLRSLDPFDPEIILATGHPPGAGPVTRQSRDLGVADLTAGPYNPKTLMMDVVGEDAFDRWVDLSCVDWEDPGYIELASRYYEEFGEFMEMDAVAGYAIARIVAESVEATGSVAPQEVADHIRANEFQIPGFAWTLAWTEWGEIAEATPVLDIVREMEPPEGVNPGANWYLEVLFRSDPLEPFQP